MIEDKFGIQHIEDDEGRKLCDHRIDDDDLQITGNCHDCWREATLQLVNLKEEVDQLRNENENLVEKIIVLEDRPDCCEGRICCACGECLIGFRHDVPLRGIMCGGCFERLGPFEPQ